MDMKPCSRVFDDDPHDPHTYYFSGHDVYCMGYSPIRETKSDLAETPEEFFGLDPITKAPLGNTPVLFDIDEFCYGEVMEPPEPTNRFQKALVWYDDLRPVYQDLILLVVVSIVFIVMSFIIHGLS